MIRIKAVSNALSALETTLVFVGGATVSLYVDEAFREETRPTDDVDVVVEVFAYNNFAAIEERLRSLGFTNDITSRVICRYQYQGITVDVMPASNNILGFGNQWYSFGFKHIVKANIDGFHHVNIFPAPFFIAAKMEAFKGRGKNDGRTSTDFEDIVFVLNNRSRVWDELELAEKNVKGYLQDEFRRVLDDPYFFEWISCHIGYHEQRRTSFIIGGLTHFVNH